MKKRALGIMLCVALELTPVLAPAEESLSDQDLAQAMNELEVAKVYVHKAKAHQPTNQRVVFHYEWVLSDINKIEAGIEQKFHRLTVQPRVIQPIQGDYIKVVGAR